MRRPTGPMTGLGGGKAGENATCFDILAQRDIYSAGIRRASGLELERTVLFYVCVTHDLEGILVIYFGSALNQIDRACRGNLDIGVARQINRIIASERHCL